MKIKFQGEVHSIEMLHLEKKRTVFKDIYCKNPKYSDTPKFDVITLKFEEDVTLPKNNAPKRCRRNDKQCRL